MARNPVMFVVEVGSVLTTFIFFRDLGDADADQNLFAGLVAAWLWFTVLFANFAEAMAEGRGKAQADTLRKARSETVATAGVPTAPSSKSRRPSYGRRRVHRVGRRDHPRRRRGHRRHRLGRRVGDHRRVRAGDPGVGRRPLGRHRRHPRAVRPDRRAHHRRAGETFLDRMIALVEGASRQKTPNEIALNILLAGLTIIFLLATVTLQPFAIYSGAEQASSSSSRCSSA